MQCHGYLPIYRPQYDLNVDTSGGSRPVYNEFGAFQSGHWNNYGPTLPIPQAIFDQKELVRETMVMHEVTFRDQVQELHRLYRRQRELMTEIKSKELYLNDMKLEVKSSNSSSAVLSSSAQDNNVHTLPLFSSKYRSGLMDTDNVQRAFNCIEFTPPKIPVTSQNDGHVDKFPVSKVKKIGGKLLDLELPGEEYLDSDELESLRDTQYLEKSRGFPEMGGTPDISERNVISSFTAFGRIMTSLSLSDDTESEVHIRKSRLVVQALPSLNNHSFSSKNAKLFHRSKESIKTSFGVGSRCNMPPSLRSSRSESKLACMSSTTSNHLNSAIFDPFSGKDLFEGPSSCENTVSAKQNGSSFNSLDGETMRKIKRCRLIDINLPCDPITDDEPFIEDVLEGLIDLNICMTDDGLPTKSSSLHKIGVVIDLEAPASPEVEEGVPPRGDNLGERIQIAAEAIVSMSYKTHLFSETKNWQKCEISDGWCLEWFAELVCSFSNELGNNIGTPRLPEIDDFEAMTLKLTEIISEEYFYGNSVEISSQTRRSRTRRSKRKDFQREVLSALASLSRVEVTEDIQLLEGLMEAAGTPWQLRTRKGRMGRKLQVIKKQPSSTNVLELKGELVISWGMDNRRPRGHRSPASHSVVMSRWLEFGE